MVMLPHLEECIKILFVNVNRCSVSLLSLHLTASVQAQKCCEEMLLKAELCLLVFPCFVRRELQDAQGFHRENLLAWFFVKLEVFRD